MVSLYIVFALSLIQCTYLNKHISTKSALQNPIIGELYREHLFFEVSPSHTLVATKYLASSILSENGIL